MNVPTRQRAEPTARAIARILAVASMLDEDDLPAALVEAFDKAREALDDRDREYDHRLLVVSDSQSEAAVWIDRHQIERGAQCSPVLTVDDLTLHPLPVTVVLLPSARRREDWPQIAAQLAALGPNADTIGLPGA